VLGPVLFSIWYISPISSLIAAHNLQHQQYADDTQLFISVSPTDSTLSVSRLESFLSDLYCWLSPEMLQVLKPQVQVQVPDPQVEVQVQALRSQVQVQVQVPETNYQVQPKYRYGYPLYS